MSNGLRPNRRTVGQRESDQRGVNSMHHPGFQTPGFTKYALTGPKALLDLVCHIFQLSLPCQFFYSE